MANVFCELGGFYLTSRLTRAHSEALEKLCFFNSQQYKMREAIRRAVERYGSPRIKTADERVTLQLASFPQAQVLYLMEVAKTSSLAGVVVYERNGCSLRILYLALRPEYTFKVTGQRYLFLELLDRMRDIGKQISGVERIEVDIGSALVKLKVHAE